MDIKEVTILGDAVEAHWYYRAKAAAVNELLAGSHYAAVLDVGAGSGFFSRQLLREGVADAAWCLDIAYEADSDESEAGRPLHFRRAIEHVDASLVLMMDVLEHVDDDVALVRDLLPKVPAGTTFLVSVPAFQWLWSPHDDFLEHRRRYTLKQLEQVLRAAGLEVQRGNYFYGAVFPIAAVLRLIARLRPAKAPASDLRRHSGFVNGLLNGLCRAELGVMRYNRLAGLSVFCLARVPAAAG